MSKKKIYISLPITGRDFDEVESEILYVSGVLEREGYHVVTPIDFDVNPDLDKPYHELLGNDIKALMECDDICLCPGWEKSKGCQLEHFAAKLWDKEIMEFEKLKNKEDMERKVGEIFEYNGEWYQCVEQPKQYDCETGCGLCSFKIIGNCDLDKCSGTYRSDGKSVIFKKLEKVGEPYVNDDRTYQLYKLTVNVEKLSCQCDGVNLIRFDMVEIEIKKNKEDMNKKKLNLKEFDLEAAKAGKPVCTRDGRKARIICFDAKRKDGENIIALIPSRRYPGFEYLVTYTNNGNYRGEHENGFDLMMLPE